MATALLIGYLVVSFISNELVQGQESVPDDPSSCFSSWNSFSKCLHKEGKHQIALAGLGEPNDTQKAAVEVGVKSCFQRFNCGNPFGSATVSNSRIRCFQDTRSSLRSDLESCVRLENFALPDDNFADMGLWTLFLYTVNSVVHNSQKWCGQGVAKSQLRQCVESAFVSVINTNRQANARRRMSGSLNTYCQQRDRCKAAENLSPDCEKRWTTDAYPELCRCVNEMLSSGRRTTYFRKYALCMNIDRIRIDGKDPALEWINTVLTAWCPNNKTSSSADPCSNSQQSNGRNGANFGGNSNFRGPTVRPGNRQELRSDGMLEQDFEISTTSAPIGEQNDGLFGGLGNLGGGGGGGGGNPLGGLLGGGGNGLFGGGGGNGLFGGGGGGNAINGLFGGGNGGPLGGGLGGGGLGGGFNPFQNLLGGSNLGGDLFGGFLNNLGMANAFEPGGLLGQFASGFGDIIKNLFNIGRR